MTRAVRVSASAIEPPGRRSVAEVISRTVRQPGVGCASRMAWESGEHPQAAIDRMRRAVARSGGGSPLWKPKLRSSASFY